MTTVTSRSSVRPLPAEAQDVAKTPLALPRATGNGASAHGGRASEHRLGMATIAACALLMLLVPLVSYPPALRVPAGLVDRTPRYTALSASESRVSAGHPGRTSTVTVGVVNHEGATRRYALTLSTEAAANHGAADVSLWLNLRPGERWARPLSVPCA